MNFSVQAVATANPAERIWRDGFWSAALGLFFIALMARLAYLPMTTLDTGDTAARTWMGWLWGDDPYLITYGIWGPLHYYLVGAAMRIWPDPVWAMHALHMLIGSMVPVVVYCLTLELFGGRRSAIAAGLIFAAYPAAISVSLGTLAESPQLLFLGIGLVFLVRAWRPNGRLRDAALAGFAITIASMLRYESWMLLPFLTILLIRHPKRAAVFLVIAMVHPVFWMIGNGLQFGEPLHGLIAGANWRADVVGADPVVGFAGGIGKAWLFIQKVVVELSVVTSLLVAWGAVRCLLERRREAIWLIPPLGLLLLFVVAAAQGSLTMKSGYTTVIGLLLIPFVACAFEWFHIADWSKGKCLVTATVLVAAIGICSLEPLWRSIPGGTRLLSHPAPGFPDQAHARELLSLVERAGLRQDEALITEFVGSLATPYVALQTKLHPRRICRPLGLPNQPLTSDQLEHFLMANRSGVLVSGRSGKLAPHLQRESERAAVLAGIRLRLEPVGNMEWHGHKHEMSFGTLTVSRYAVVGNPEAPARERPSCTSGCPMALCL